MCDKLFTNEEINIMNEEFRKKREYFREHPEEAKKYSYKRIKKDNEDFLKFLKKQDRRNLKCNIN